MNITPKDVERMVKKLKKHPKISDPWALAEWMKEQGYKMPKKKSKKGEEEKGEPMPMYVPGKSFPKTREYLKQQKRLAEEEIRPKPTPKTDLNGLKTIPFTPKIKGPIKLTKVAEEKQPRDYSVWLRQQDDKKMKSPLQKIFKGNHISEEFLEWLPEDKRKEIESLCNQFMVDDMSKEGQKREEPDFHAEEYGDVMPPLPPTRQYKPDPGAKKWRQQFKN